MNRRTGVILSIVSILFEVLSTLVLTPFLIKTLGPSEFGVYKLCLSIIAYVLLLDLGIGNSVIRFASKYRFNNDAESANKLAGVSMAFYLIIAILSLVAGAIIVFIFPFAFAKGLSTAEIALGQKLIVFTTIASSITLGTSGFYNIIIAHERFIISKGFNIVQILLKIVLSFIVLKFGGGSVGVCIVNLALTTFIRFFYVFYAIKRLKIKPALKGCDKAFVGEILGYSALIAIQMVATQMNQSLDQILIGALVPQSSGILGVYAVGAQINQYFMSIGVAITGVLMPGIVKFIESKPSEESMTNEIIRLSRIISYPLLILFGGFILLGKPFISLWTDPSYAEAYLVALILIAPQLVISVLTPCTQILWALNQQKELSWAKLFVVVANIFLTIALIQWNPLLGASIGTMISVIVGDFFVLSIITKRKIGLPISYYYGNVFLMPIIIIFSTALLTNRIFGFIFDIDRWLRLFIVGASFLLMTLPCVYLFCFNASEKERVTNVLTKLLKGIKHGKQNH